MNALKKILFVLLALFVTMSSWATVRRVGLNQTYSTLTAAYNAAANDDTLLISPGVYSESITSTKRLTWLGAGYDEVTVNGFFVLNSGSSGSRIEGLKIIASRSSGGAIELAATVDLIDISRCWLYNQINQSFNAASCVLRTASPGGSLSIKSCILEPVNLSGGGAFCLALNGENAVIRNSVLHRRATSSSAVIGVTGPCQSILMQNCVSLNLSSLNITSGNVTCTNNIQYDGSFGWGTYPPDAVFNYNASQIAPPGSNGITLTANPFVNYNTANHFQYGISDLRVTGSVCENSGDPAILDRDGSRSDMGIYGGQTPHLDGGAPNYPFTIDLQVPASMTSGQQLPIQATGRIGAGY